MHDWGLNSTLCTKQHAQPLFYTLKQDPTKLPSVLNHVSLGQNTNTHNLMEVRFILAHDDSP